jgi:uncharacterized BrkB/YihY/UPF0761 family membrane protein
MRGWAGATADRAQVWAGNMREGHATVETGFRIVERDRQVAAMVLAGGIAYRIFFWLLSLALVIGGILGLFDPNGVEDAVHRQGISVGLAGAISVAANAADGNSWWLLTLGGWLLFWTGYTAAKALVLTHATIWGVQARRLTSRLRASLCFNAGVLSFVAAMTGARWVRVHSSTGIGLVATLVVFLLPFGFWLIASRILPNRAVDWLDLVPGALVFAIGEQVLNLFTAYFLGPKLTNATQLYGLAGIATTLLLWFYITGRLIIGAANLNASFSEQRHR